MTGILRHRLYWLFCVTALIAWIAIGWPVVQGYWDGSHRFEGFRIPVGAAAMAGFAACFAFYGIALIAGMTAPLGLRAALALSAVQVACVVGLTMILDDLVLSVLLVAIAWQVALRLSARAALAWVLAQTFLLIGGLAGARPDFEFCYTVGLVVALQAFFVFTADALRTEARTSRALARTNIELRAAQAMIAANARAIERTRISRELHDAWGHELTALGLQLEIASHTVEEGRARGGVMQARAMASSLLVKVRDVVSALREAERCDLREALDALAASVPLPAVHVDLQPELAIGPDQAHALVRCAQEAVTNAVRHSQAANLWLKVEADARGLRLTARDDGRNAVEPGAKCHGLRGMRERLEQLGGGLEIKGGDGDGFVLDAWLPRAAAAKAA
ncbi:MAG TPA: sensor histidine kinase [Allosphingosinicella sp.]|nr:sensor histidine kinase [Allosphingosinicella sp.]